MEIKIRRSIFKRFLSKTVLKVLGNAVEAVDKLDANAHRDLSVYKEGCVIGMRAFPEGQTMFLTRENGFFNYSGFVSNLSPDYLIVFKSLDDAVPVLIGIMGIEQAFIEHRFTLDGDLMTSLPLVRSLGIVEAYLFPAFMLRKIFLQVPLTEKAKTIGLIKIIITILKSRRHA